MEIYYIFKYVKLISSSGWGRSLMPKRTGG